MLWFQHVARLQVTFSLWSLDIHSTLFLTELELQVCVQHSTKFANKPFQHIKYTDDPDSDDFDIAEMRTAKAVCPFKAIKTVQCQEKKNINCHNANVYST